jgi:hypothetical protein
MGDGRQARIGDSEMEKAGREQKNLNIQMRLAEVREGAPSRKVVLGVDSDDEDNEEKC